MPSTVTCSVTPSAWNVLRVSSVFADAISKASGKRLGMKFNVRKPINGASRLITIIKPIDANINAENEALRKELAEMRKLLLDLKNEKPPKTK